MKAANLLAASLLLCAFPAGAAPATVDLGPVRAYQFLRPGATPKLDQCTLLPMQQLSAENFSQLVEQSRLHLLHADSSFGTPPEKDGRCRVKAEALTAADAPVSLVAVRVSTLYFDHWPLRSHFPAGARSAKGLPVPPKARIDRHATALQAVPAQPRGDSLPGHRLALVCWPSPKGWPFKSGELTAENSCEWHLWPVKSETNYPELAAVPGIGSPFSPDESPERSHFVLSGEFPYSAAPSRIRETPPGKPVDKLPLGEIRFDPAPAALGPTAEQAREAAADAASNAAGAVSRECPPCSAGAAAAAKFPAAAGTPAALDFPPCRAEVLPRLAQWAERFQLSLDRDGKGELAPHFQPSTRCGHAALLRAAMERAAHCRVTMPAGCDAGAPR